MAIRCRPFRRLRIGGTDGSKYWIGDYTIEPENGGVGVFAHEFGHDLGLPDEYDTSGNTGGAENSTAWWTLVVPGLVRHVSDDLGTSPVNARCGRRSSSAGSTTMSPSRGRASSTRSAPSKSTPSRPRRVVVVLPDKEFDVELGDPYAGSFFYHSGTGDGLDNNMTRPVTLGAGPYHVSFQGSWHIEPCWDYAYFQVSTNGGTTFTNIANVGVDRRRTRMARTSAMASPVPPAPRSSAT